MSRYDWLSSKLDYIARIAVLIVRDNNEVKREIEVSETTQNNAEKRSSKIPLEVLAKMTGFSIDHIKQELQISDEDLTLSDLRGYVEKYLNLANTSIAE